MKKNIQNNGIRSNVSSRENKRHKKDNLQELQIVFNFLFVSKKITLVFVASVRMDRLGESAGQETKSVWLHPLVTVLLRNEPVFDSLIDVIMCLSSSSTPQISVYLASNGKDLISRILGTCDHRWYLKSLETPMHEDFEKRTDTKEFDQLINILEFVRWTAIEIHQIFFRFNVDL